MQVLTVPKSSIQSWQAIADGQVIQEALEILKEHMKPEKLARFLVVCHLD